MIAFDCGTYANKPKRCLHCKYFWLWGLGGGSCMRLNKNDDYKSANDHCKYYKRDNEMFYSDCRIKDQEKYDEMFM